MKRKKRQIHNWLFALALLVLFSEVAVSQIAGYTNRLKGQINNGRVSGTSNLSNFPVLMSFTLPDLRSTGNGGLVQSVNGYDILFTAANGTTILSHQIENYVPTTGQIEIWVRFPTLLATSDTEFYMYYGNSGIVSDPSSPNVWDSNYKMVLHMNNDTNDAAGEGTDATDSGTADIEGQIGRARNYGTNEGDLIQVPDPGVSPLDITGNITVSFWINISNLADGPDLITKGTYTDGYSMWITNNGNLRFQINNNALNGSANNQIANGVWSYLTFTRSPSGRSIYVNGSPDASDASGVSFNTNNDPLFISTTAFDFEGSMDEVRISNTTRNADWIATEYNNQSSPLTFVAQLNAEPVLQTIEGSTITFNSGDAPKTITSTIVVSDGDDTNLESAEVSISNNFTLTEDELVFTDQLGITGSYASSTGVLTLTGTTTSANYQTAIRSITYRNSDTSPTENTRTVSITVSDGSDDSNTLTRNINVVKVNNDPVLSNLESSSLIFFPGSSAKQISNTIEITDIDDTNIESATIQISSNYLSSEDTLEFTNQNGITSSWNDISGTLTLSGSATKTNYENAIRSITYLNSNGAPDMSVRTLSFTVSDGSDNSSTLTRDIEIPDSISDPSTDFSNTVFHFDAFDVDGDLLTNDQPGDGTGVSTWGDRSDNAGGSSVDLSGTTSPASDEPTFDSGYFGERGGLLFDGTNDKFDVPDNTINNTGTYTEKSFAVVFRTGSSTAGLQIIYEQGGGTRGYQISIKDGIAYAFVWNNSEWGASDQYKSINIGAVSTNTNYILIASHDATSGTVATSTWSANINGGSITTLTDVDFQRAHSGDAVIGEEDGTRDPATTANNPSGTNNFNGIIGEFISWNDALSAGDFTNLYAYLSDKWFNKAPLLSSIEGSSLSYSEGDPATTISSSLIVSDSDNSVLESAEVSISEGFNNSEDVLAFTNQLGITGNWNSTTGILTLSGSSSVANYQTALRSVTYENTNGLNPSTVTREISFQVFDFEDASGVVSREVDIIPSNATPVLAAIEGSTIAFTENDGPTSLTSTITISDGDDVNLESATIQITNNYFLGEDVLDFIDANGITSSFNTGTGTLTLSGTATVANYQTALRAVTFENISSDPVTGLDRMVTITVNDGLDDSNTQTRDISVSSVNTPPSLDDIESDAILYTTGDSLEVSDDITISDADDANIETVTFQITGNYDSSEDTLVFADIFGVTDSWTDGTGLLTLTGPASRADFQSAIRTVRYANTSSNPSDQQRTISIIANDGDDNSNTLIRNVTVSVPATINDLTVWLKGDDGTFNATTGGSASTNGGNVRRWEDQSGNNHHFITSGTAPTLQTSVGSINSQNAIEFPGGGTVVRLEDADAETQYLNGLDQFTIFFVIESDITSTDRGFWTTYQPDGTGDDKFFNIRYDATGTSGTNIITAGLREGASSNFLLQSFSDAQTTSGQIIALKWQSEEIFDLYVDGVLNNPSASGNIPTGLLTNLTTAILGQSSQDQNNSWDGLIAEMLFYSRDLTLSEQQNIEDYLSVKYGIPIRNLTAATGGEAISADDASTTYTTLSGPRVQESFIGEYTSSGTFVFRAPTGFEWDTGGSAPSASVAPAFGGSTNLAISFTGRTSNEITFTVTTPSSTNPAEITFSGFRVRPTTGVLPNEGIITNVGTTGSGGTTNYGTLTMVAGTQIAMAYSQQPGTSTVNSAITPSVRVQLEDQFGNSVEEGGVDIDIALNVVSGSGAFTGSSTTTIRTNSLGIAEFTNLLIDDTGSYTLTASSSGLTSQLSSQFDVVILGQLTEFIVERVPSGNISNKLAGQSFNIKISAVDGTDDVVTDFTGTVDISSSCTLDAGQGTSPSFSAGVLSTLTVSITSVGSCSITATNSAGSEIGVSNNFNVTPGAASETTTQITASPTVIFNDGFSTSTITVQVQDASGNNRTTGGATIVLSTTDGSLGSVTDNSNGTYTATLTSSIVEGTATITGTLNSNAITDNAQVEFAAFNNIWQSQVGSISDARNWDDDANWSSGSAPIVSDKVLIPATPSVGNQQPVVDVTNTTIAQISLETSASVTVSGGVNFVVTGEASGGGKILGSNADSLTVGGNLDVLDITLGNVILNGSSQQIVTSPNDYVDLELDNSAGANFSADLTVTGDLNLTDGTLFIPSGKNLIANSKTYGVGGSLRFQRRISGARGWRMVSSPVNTTYGDFLDGTLTQGYTGSTLGSAALDSLQPNVLTYLESFEGTDNQRYRAPTNATQSVTQGQGIFVFIFGNVAADARYNDPIPDTLDVEGQEWDGDGTEVDFGITYTATADTGWNLVGNPFAATIDWDDSPNWTKTNVENTIYVWDPSANGGNGEYLTWNGTTGTLGGGLISPFQGFWVKANAASPVLAVDKEAKTTGGSFKRKENKETVSDPQMEFSLQADGLSKKTNIMFSSTAGKAKDNNDGYRLLPFSSTHLELHTLLEDGTELAINNLPLDFNSRYKIPLHIAAYRDGIPFSGEMELIWSGLRNIPDDWIITLIDNDTQDEINIKDQTSYTFNHSTRSKISKTNPFSPGSKLKSKGKVSADGARFTLLISTEQIELEVPEEVFLAQNYPNPFNPTTTIPFGIDEDADVSIIIYDILGRKVHTLVNKRLTAGTYDVTFQANHLASGVYFYRLITQSKVLVEKFTLIK